MKTMIENLDDKNNDGKIMMEHNDGKSQWQQWRHQC